MSTTVQGVFPVLGELDSNQGHQASLVKKSRITQGGWGKRGASGMGGASHVASEESDSRSEAPF